MAELNTAKIAFVSGSTGFVGLNLVRELIRQHWHVVALHRAGSDLKYLQDTGAELKVGDILDTASLQAAMPEGVDAVFHVAADTNFWPRNNERQTRINVQGTRNMVEVALAKGAKRFIHTGTASAYGRQKIRLRDDTPSVAGQSWINYERSKWLAEQEVRSGIKKGLAAVIVNPSAVLGPYDLHSWAMTFFMIRDGKLKGLPPGRTSFNHVSEVAKALVAAVEKGRIGDSYILTGEEAGFADVFHIMADLLGVKLEAKIMPAALLITMGYVMNLISYITGKQPDITAEMAALMSGDMLYDTDKAERELGYKPIPVKTCVADSFNWLKAEGLL